jgi:hypothetical protein
MGTSTARPCMVGLHGLPRENPRGSPTTHEKAAPVESRSDVLGELILGFRVAVVRPRAVLRPLREVRGDQRRQQLPVGAASQRGSRKGCQQQPRAGAHGWLLEHFQTNQPNQADGTTTERPAKRSGHHQPTEQAKSAREQTSSSVGGGQEDRRTGGRKEKQSASTERCRLLREPRRASERPSVVNGSPPSETVKRKTSIKSRPRQTQQPQLGEKHRRGRFGWARSP